MKKLITAIGIIVVLVSGTYLGTMAVRDMKQSLEEYINNDVVGIPDNNTIDNKQLANDITDTEYNLDLGQSSKKTKDQSSIEIVESNIFTDNNNQVNNKKQNIKQNKIQSITKNNEIINKINDNSKTNQTYESIDTNKSNENIKTRENERNHSTVSDSTLNINNQRQVVNTESIQSKETSSDAEEYSGDISNRNTRLTKAKDDYKSDTDIQNGVGTSSHLSLKEENHENISIIKAEAVETALDIINPSIAINATSAILLNANSGKVIYYKNATTPIYPASTTKLMTALVALDYCDIEDEITIGDEISFMAYDSSRAYLAQGQRLTLKMLLEGMLIPSGNDAAYSVAAYVGRVSLRDNTASSKEAVNEFIRLMNQKVKYLGLTSTCFKNPDGYDADGQYTTAYDMGVIAIKALKNPIIKDIVSKTSVRNVFLSGEDVTWHSSNKLIDPYSGMYYKYAVGLKTGSSSLAGRCLVSAAKKENKTIISVVMNSTITGRWEDSRALLQYGIDN